MAQSESFYDYVKKELECPVCQEIFTKNNVPKVLKCQHTFCKSCLEKWLRQHRGGALSCPNCRELTDCPNDDINNLPSNLTYKKLRDILEAFSKGRENECERHKERVKFYCEQCEICICSECVIVEHRDKDHHNILTLEEGVMKQKGKLECKVAEAKVSRSHLVSYIASLQKRNENINNSIDRATDEVHRVTEHWINLIRQHEISVTEQLRMQRSSFHETFSKQLSNSNEKLLGIDKLLELSGKVLQENNLTEILNVKEVLERRSRELSTDVKLTPYLDIKYIPNDKLPLNYAPGKLVTTCTEPSMSVAKGRGLIEISEGEEGTFTVITNDSEGKRTYSEIDNVVVEIKSNQRRIKDIDPVIKDLKDGRYSVAYTSSVGEFNVSIKVRGEPIKGSPFKLKILKKKVNTDSASGGESSETKCPGCLNTLTNARTLKCKHVFCTECLETALAYNNRCPVCIEEVQGVIKGNQPQGTMRVFRNHQSLPSYFGFGTIIIQYSIPSGIQGQEHPSPGQRYSGTTRTAYLPDNQEGNEVLQLLRRAFDARLIFTVGTSVTTGMQNQVTWNDIHHKTSMSGGPQGYGYPDPGYLKRVKEDLAAKGIR